MTIKRHLPNAVTLCNLLCGCLAIVFALKGVFYAAFIFILFGALFDFCDGLIARVLSAYSEIGKELDSLSDLVTFGVAPAVMGVEFIIYCIGYNWLCYIPLIIPICAALRLAKFNLDNSQSVTFLGLPTPASGILFSAMVLYLKLYLSSYNMLFFELGTISRNSVSVGLIIFIAIVISAMMVSSIPMFSLKLKSFAYNENKLRYRFLAITLIELIVIFALYDFFTCGVGFTKKGAMMIFAFALFILLLTYIIYNILIDLLCRKK